MQNTLRFTVSGLNLEHRIIDHFGINYHHGLQEFDRTHEPFQRFKFGTE